MAGRKHAATGYDFTASANCNRCWLEKLRVLAQGKYRREKIGTFSAARKLLDKRRGEAVEGRKLPALLQRAVSFAELADDAIAYVKDKYSRPMMWPGSNC